MRERETEGEKEIVPSVWPWGAWRVWRDRGWLNERKIEREKR